MSTYNILIVDDFLVIRETLPKILAKFGFNAIAVSSGWEALVHLQENSVDLVITDIQMPGMSGLELLETIKTKYDGLPVLVISGAIHKHEEARLSMADGFLAKPFAIDEILKKINNCLEK